MSTALLFRLSKANGPPDWLVCLDEAVAAYTDRTRPEWDGWFFLISQNQIEEQRTADIQAVRDLDEFRWSALSSRRRRWRSRRHGSTGE